MENLPINISELDISDFVTPYSELSHNSNNSNNRRNEKSKGYRQQVEYGAKKYIKP
jgi:hypothetical protein